MKNLYLNLNPKDRIYVIVLIALLLTLFCTAEYQTYREYKKREEIDKVLIEHKLAVYTVDVFGNKRLELIKNDNNEKRD